MTDTTLRETILDIVSRELIDASGRLNGKLLRSNKFCYLRDMVYEVSSCLDEQDDITHRLRWIQLGYTNPPICKICGKRVRYQKQTQLFNTYCCSRCRQSDELVVNKIKQTNLQRYGVEYACVSEASISKQHETNIKRYGAKKPFQSKELQQHIRKNTIDKYGVVSTALLPEISSKQKQTRQKRYGVDFLFQSKTFQQQIKEQTKIKYNGKHTTQLHIPDETYEKLHDSDWLYEQYVNNGKNLTHISNELDVSDLTVAKYIKQCGIQIRDTNKYSQMCIQWLESIMEQQNIFIQHAMNGGEYKIPGTRYRADGYCAETNTIYEFHGDYWHGNPKLFESEIYNEFTQCSMGELYQRTIKKEQVIKELGYNLVSIWESDFSL